MLSHLKGLQVSDRDPNNMVLFLHLPKTGGTSMCRVLSDQFGDKYKRLETTSFKDGLDLFPASSGYKAFAGHFDLSNLNYSKWAGTPLNHLTILRDPIERCLSQYFYLRNTPEHRLHSTALQYSIEEIYANKLGNRVGMENTQIRLLCSLSPTKNNSWQALLYAKENLTKLFTRIGLTEHFDEFIQMCVEDFGWNISEIPKLNQCPRDMSETDLKDARDIISRNNNLDRPLYEFAKELYEKQKLDYILVDISVDVPVDVPVDIDSVLDEKPETTESIDKAVTPKLSRWKRFKQWVKRLFKTT
jgi:hypothetical protein